MATGTSAGLLSTQHAQSVFKHAILNQYVIQYATMTSSKLTPRRCLLVDGFAGQGRYDDGSAASAEYMMLAAQKAKGHTQIPVYLVEKQLKAYRRLDAVADEYRARGLEVTSRLGDCQEYMDEIVAKAQGASLFLFLDPCGANLAFDDLRRVLGVQRRRPWPRSEALLNFSANFTRRAAGAVNKGLRDHESVPALNTVCGADWWQQVAIDAHEAAQAGTWEAAAEAVVSEYARRLRTATHMHTVVAPVRKKAHHQPVYHLVFLTRDDHGLWAFGNSLAVARQHWLRELGPAEEELEGMLFDSVEEQIAAEQAAAVGPIRSNILSQLADGRHRRVVDMTAEIFGDQYGIAKETAVSKAIRELVRDDEIRVVTKGKKVRQHVLARVS